jgi:hypothetical protein
MEDDGRLSSSAAAFSFDPVVRPVDERCRAARVFPDEPARPAVRRILPRRCRLGSPPLRSRGWLRSPRGRAASSRMLCPRSLYGAATGRQALGDCVVRHKRTANPSAWAHRRAWRGPRIKEYVLATFSGTELCEAAISTFKKQIGWAGRLPNRSCVCYWIHRARRSQDWAHGGPLHN